MVNLVPSLSFSVVPSIYFYFLSYFFSLFGFPFSFFFPFFPTGVFFFFCTGRHFCVVFFDTLPFFLPSTYFLPLPMPYPRPTRRLSFSSLLMFLVSTISSLVEIYRTPIFPSRPFFPPGLLPNFLSFPFPLSLIVRSFSRAFSSWPYFFSSVVMSAPLGAVSVLLPCPLVFISIISFLIFREFFPKSLLPFARPLFFPHPPVLISLGFPLFFFPPSRCFFSCHLKPLS